MFTNPQKQQTFLEHNILSGYFNGVQLCTWFEFSVGTVRHKSLASYRRAIEMACNSARDVNFPLERFAAPRFLKGPKGGPFDAIFDPLDLIFLPV